MRYEQSRHVPETTSTPYWVCWSLRQFQKYGEDSLIHLQGKAKGKTLCGIATDGYWDFQVHWRLASVDSIVDTEKSIQLSSLSVGKD
jgi:hypothetical protein